MPDYRCLFVDNHDQVRDIERLANCLNDAVADRLAMTMLAERPPHHGVEVWDRGRKVSRHLRAECRPMGGFPREPARSESRSVEDGRARSSHPR